MLSETWNSKSRETEKVNREDEGMKMDVVQ